MTYMKDDLLDDLHEARQENQALRSRIEALRAVFRLLIANEPNSLEVTHMAEQALAADDEVGK